MRRTQRSSMTQIRIAIFRANTEKAGSPRLVEFMNSNERNESRLSRRQLLKTAATAGVAGAFALSADPLGMPIGCQLWPVRKMLGEDFEGTLAQLAAIGYKRVEMCSPASYAEGFGPLASKRADEVRHSIEAAGLVCES